jgi:hypothetical protein
METFLYTLAFAFIGVLASIAYKHPSAYHYYVGPALTLLFIFVFVFAAGYYVAMLVAHMLVVKAIGEIKPHQPGIFAVNDAIAAGEIPTAAWVALWGMLIYVLFLSFLPTLGLTADTKHPTTQP